MSADTVYETITSASASNLVENTLVFIIKKFPFCKVIIIKLRGYRSAVLSTAKDAKEVTTPLAITERMALSFNFLLKLYPQKNHY